MVWQTCHIWTTVTLKIYMRVIYFKPSQSSLQSRLRQISFLPPQTDGASCVLHTPGASLEVGTSLVTSPLLLAASSCPSRVLQGPNPHQQGLGRGWDRTGPGRRILSQISSSVYSWVLFSPGGTTAIQNSQAGDSMQKKHILDIYVLYCRIFVY